MEMARAYKFRVYPDAARQEEIHHLERVKARREKGPKNREKAEGRIQDTWQKATSQSIDFIQKETMALITSGIYPSFVMEELQTRNMAKCHHYARSIQKASWGMSKTVLSYKAESAGMRVIPVPYEYTSQTCGRCHNVKKGEDKLQRGERIYNCKVCGLIMGRDINAAKNILEKAREGHSRSNASGDATYTIQKGLQAVSMNQEHTLQDAVIA